MEQIIFFIIVILLTGLGVFANRFLHHLNPILLWFPITTLLLLIGLSIYLGRQMEGLGALAYVIYLIVLIPIALVVGIDAIILYIKNKRVAK